MTRIKLNEELFLVQGWKLDLLVLRLREVGEQSSPRIKKALDEIAGEPLQLPS